MTPELPPQPEISFTDRVKERLPLWQTIVAESSIADDVKEKITAALERLASGAYQSVDDAIYYTIDQLVQICQNTSADKADREKTAVFQNLREDLWALHKEAK